MLKKSFWLPQDENYSTIQKFAVSKIFQCFLNEGYYVHQGCIYLIKNRVKTVIFWNKLSW